MTEIPPYKQLYRLLQRKILRGEYSIGDLMPSENELSKTYGLTRNTVRKALDVLVREGLITKQVGRGSVVARNRNSLGLLSIRGFSEVVGTLTLEAKSEILDPPSLREWPKPFFYPLTAEQAKRKCIHVRRIRKVNDEPVMLANTFVDNAGLESLLTNPFVEGSLFKTLHLEHGIEVTNLIQDVRAISAYGEAAQHLDTEPGTPLLQVYLKYVTSRENFFIYSLLYCNTEKYTIGNTF